VTAQENNTKALTHIVGTFLIQAEGAFLNGAGLGRGEDKNTTIPKTLSNFKDEVPYVSAQAWKRWLRDTYQSENPGDPAVVIQTTDVNEKNNTKKLGSTLDPVMFAEDDIFGYMQTRQGQGTKAAESEQSEDEEDEEDSGGGREKVKPTMRTSPFHASILMSLRKTGWRGLDKGFVYPKSVAPELLEKNPEARSTPLPYDTKFYNTQLQGIFGLSYSRLGEFRNEGDRIELDLPLVTRYLKENRIAKVDGKREIYRLVNNPRKERAAKILKSLSVMRGGAKQAQFGTPVHPQAIVVAGLSCGNLIFNHLFEDTKEGPIFKLETFEEVVRDFADRIVTSVYIGIRTGYLNPESERRIRERFSTQDGTNSLNAKVVVCTPIEAINRVAAELPE
jgi:CRISPR-associated protein Cst2